MRNSPWTTLVAAGIACATPVGNAIAADAPAAQLPAAIVADLKSIAAQCTEVGGKARTDAAVTRVDLTGDGHDDFVLDVGAVNCDGAASIYGDREKGVTVYTGDGKGGADPAFSDWVYGAAIEGTGADAKLWLDVSGGNCGKPPAKDFATENFCSRAVLWNPATKKFDYAPMSAARMMQ